MTKRQDRDSIYVKRQFDTEIIVLCVRWYISYRLSYRDLVAMMAERGVSVSHTTIMRWVIRYVPEFEKCWNRFARSIGSSWRVDETYISIKGKWLSVPSVDKQGRSVDFVLRPDWGIAAAQAFFRKALASHADRAPRKVTLDGHVPSHRVGRGTVANVLKRSGIEPSSERSKRTTWSTFLKAHWKVLAASDFLTVEVWTGRGLVTHYLLLVISLVDRVVQIAGITTRPDEAWMLQVARNLVDEEAGVLHAKRYLIIDRDTKYSDQFRRLIRDNGTKVIRLPPMSPNLNAYAERFVRSIKLECLNRMIFIGEASLRRAVAEYVAHYHGERNHQGLNNRLIRGAQTVAANDGVVHRRPRLGGMLNFYYREAA